MRDRIAANYTTRHATYLTWFPKAVYLLRFEVSASRRHHEQGNSTKIIKPWFGIMVRRIPEDIPLLEKKIDEIALLKSKGQSSGYRPTSGQARNRTSEQITSMSFLLSTPDCRDS